MWYELDCEEPAARGGCQAGDDPKQLPSETQGAQCYFAHHRTLLVRMELTASGMPATMRCSVLERLACVLTTHSWANSLPKPQNLGSMAPADQAPTR